MQKQLPNVPKIPKETEDEVGCFHPAFNFAANTAIDELGLSGEINLIHHYPIGSRIVDFAFQRASSAKMVLLAEIKRTKAAVQSTNYRLQAQNYVTEAGGLCASPHQGQERRR